MKKRVISRKIICRTAAYFAAGSRQGQILKNSGGLGLEVQS